MLAPARILVPLLIVAVLAGPLASIASADGGCGAAGRPACTILRPAGGPGSPRVVPVDAGECIVLVGGLGSRPDETRDFFRPLIATFNDDPRYDIRTFGAERRDAYPYDTYGAIAPNALRLRALIRDLSAECIAIDVVAHSMGGAVADRAFSLGLSARDGVATYLPLSSPHNGATFARAVRAGVETDADFAALASAIARSLGVHDPTTDAVRDLARARAPRAIRDLATARLRLVTDALVLRRDSADRRVDVRDHLPGSLAQYEGHGGVVQNEDVQRLVRTTIERHELPAEERPGDELARVARVSADWDRELSGLYVLLGAGLVGSALLTKVAVALASALADAGSEVGSLALAAIAHLDEAVFVVQPFPLSVLE